MGKALIGFLAVLSLWAGSANNTDVGMIKSIDGSGTLSVYDGNGVLHESKVDGRLFEHDKIVTKALQTVILELSEKVRSFWLRSPSSLLRNISPDAARPRFFR